MLGKINLDQRLDKKACKEELSILEDRLSGLQREIKELKIPVIIVFEGWSASGKGTLISKVLKPLDPRTFNVYTMSKVTEDMQMRPFLWSFWTKLPARGRIALFDRSWHRGLLPDGDIKWKLNATEKKNLSYDINAFEKQLYDDGNVLIKFFLHISKEEQKKRFKSIEDNPDTKWRIDTHDWEQNQNYNKHLSLYDKMLESTNSEENPWTIVESNDKNYAQVKIYKTIIERLEYEISRITEQRPWESKTDILLKPMTESALNNSDVNKDISDAKYNEKLGNLKDKISNLGFKLYKKRKSVVIVYEGWDAAGKGGNIKRLTDRLDPRGYEVIPVAAPTADEINHHYLWRFYNKLPKDGHIAIFDRSWYGRVMVERVEKFCSQQEWQRAYGEINDMERHITNNGGLILKFWLHIDKDEQLKRFKERQENPLKRYKITDEDWRNRNKWDEYEEAVDEMLFRTNTTNAPWIIVESNNKKHARIKVLEYVANRLEELLD